MAQVNYGAHINLSDNQILNAVLQHVTSDPTGVEGKIIYRSDNNTFKVYDGSNWLTLSTGAGDISAVVAGAGLTGGATSGAATVNVVGGTGITANANDIAIDSTVATLSGSQTLSNKTIAASQVTEISNITAGEGAQLENIGSTTISATQWGYLGAASGAITNSNTQLSQAQVEDFAGGLFSGNTETGITATYQAGDNTVDLVVGTLNQNTTGSAATLTSARAINGVDFNGSAPITVTAAAGTLSGNTLKSSVVSSSLTSLGTIATGVWNGTAIASAKLDADTAHLDVAQTFGAAKTFGTNNKLNFRDANSYINSPTANDLEVVATTITLDAAADIQLEGATTVTGNLSVSGNLNIDGTTTTIDSTTVAIADSMLKLAKDQANTADALDFGFYGQYGVGGTHKYAGVFRDGSVTGDPFTFFDSLQAEPGTTVNTGGTGYDLADISAGKITSADGFVGALTGNASGSAGTVTSIGNLSGDVTSSNRTTTIAADAVTYAKMQNLATGNRLLGATSAGVIGEVQVVVGMMGANSVDSAQYVDASIDNEHLANDAVDTEEIRDGAIETAKMPDAAVTMAKLANVATDTIIGRTASGTGVPKAMSAAEVRAVLGVEASSTADQTKGDIDGLAITTVGTLDTGNATAIVSAASATAAGKVELATTAEALTGTDTARAVTAAGLSARTYKGTIGDGSTTAIAVDHGLATRDVAVQMYDASSYETIYAQVVRTSATRVTVTFNTAPASNDVIILINKIQ